MQARGEETDRETAREIGERLWAVANWRWRGQGEGRFGVLYRLGTAVGEGGDGWDKSKPQFVTAVWLIVAREDSLRLTPMRTLKSHSFLLF